MKLNQMSADDVILKSRTIFLQIYEMYYKRELIYVHRTIDSEGNTINYYSNKVEDENESYE